MYQKLVQFCTGFLMCSIILMKESSAAADHSILCELCCPHLFSTSGGIINIRESPSTLHSISYIIRCLMSTEDVVIVSDEASSHPFWLNWDRYRGDESRKRVCTHAENVLLAQVKASDFLKSDLGYFQRLVPTYDPRQTTSLAAMMAKRTNFIFISNSQEQMITLISRVEKELQYLRIGLKFFWQPYIIFLWPEVQHHCSLENKDKACSPGKTVLHSLFENHQPYFTLNSGVFIFFILQKGNSTRSRNNLYLSIWECYKLKGTFILQEVTQQPQSPRLKKTIITFEEKCNNTGQGARSPMLSWMEKVNSYVFLERFLRRENFRLSPVTSSILPSDSADWIVIKRNEDGTIKLESGSSVDIYNDLQVMMNFSDDVIIGDGVQFLSSRNDSLSTAQLEKADILLNQKSITPVRGQIYSFLQPTYFNYYEAFFRQPSANTIRNIVSAPFTMSLWAITIFTWLLIVGCFYGWGYVAKRNYLCIRNDDEFIQEIGLWAVAAISQKSWYMSPSSINFKSIFYIGSIMALVCYVAYSAVIVSFLTVKTVPIQTLNDLIEYKYKFTVHESSEATVSLLQEMITNYNLHQNVIKINTENEITHLKQRTLALLSYPDLFYKTAEMQNYTEYFICTNVYSLPIGNTPYKSSMSVRKGSQFRETISTKLLIVMERGLNFRYKKIYDDNKGINCQKKNYEQGEGRTALDPVRLTDVFTAFLVIFTGWLAALSMFFTERLYRRRKTFYAIMFLTQ